MFAGAVLVLQAGASTLSPPAPESPIPARKYVYAGPPKADPHLVGVGDCVLDGAGWRPAAPSPQDHLATQNNVIRWNGPDMRIGPLGTALRDCDPRLGEHKWYANLSVFATAQKRTAIARLASEHIDEARLERAWTRAPSELRDQVQRTVNQWLDGDRPTLDADWMPLFREIGLGRGPDYGARTPHLPLNGVITSSQVSVRDYVFGREFLAAIQARMSGAPHRAEAPLPRGSWPLDSPLSAFQAGDFYPAAAANSGKSGRSTVACKVTQLGDMSDCVIVSENPGDLWFGRATMQFAKYAVHLRMDGSAPDLAPGATALITIDWRLPHD